MIILSSPFSKPLKSYFLVARCQKAGLGSGPYASWVGARAECNFEAAPAAGPDA
jgi:hypothetical protein